MKKCYLLFFAVLLGIALCGIPSVYAQEDDSDEFVLEEITVTAQKRAESQQKVPIAMEVISGAEITELGKNDIDEILGGVSNTIIEKAQDGYRVTIRGVTDNSEAFKGQSMAPPAVAINMDGVYSSQKSGSGLFDIERVEVLYGPQSTMYTSNSPGGIVNVVTANPKLDKYEGSGSLEYGNYNLVHTEGVMNAPLGDIMALRASFTTAKRDGYLTTGNDDEDTKSVRLRALIQPTEKFSFVITGENTRNNSVGFGGGVQAFDTQDGHWYEQTKAGRQAVWVDLGPVTDPWIGVTNDKVNVSDQITKKIYAQVNFDTAAGSITMTPSYSKRKGNSQMEYAPPGQQDTEVSYMTQNVEEKSFELRMSSPEDFPFVWNAGVSYYESFDQNIDESQDYLDSDPTYATITENAQGGLTGDEDPENGTTYFPHWGRWSDRQMTNEMKAFFVNVTYPITDAFRATAGYRQSWDKWITDNYEIKGEPGPVEIFRYAYEPFLMENDGDPDYKVGLEYDVADNSMLYASYATSYRVQGMGGGPPGTTATQDPEELTAYTLGAKNRFLDNSLQFNVAAYYYDYKNYRAGGNDTEVWLGDYDYDNEQDMNEGGRDGNANGTGDGRMIGLDLSANWIITPKDRLNLTASYIHSEWTDLYIDYEYNETFVGWVDDYAAPDGVPIYETIPDDDFAGETMMQTPPLNINLTYDHNFTLPNGGSLKTALTVKYKTSYDLTWRKQDYPINHQENFHTEDINLVYNDPGGNLSLSLYCKNLTDYAEKRGIVNMAGTKLLSIGNPRTYGGVLSINF